MNNQVLQNTPPGVKGEVCPDAENNINKTENNVMSSCFFRVYKHEKHNLDHSFD